MIGSEMPVPAAIVIGALRKVAKYNLEGKSIDQALLLVANEIEAGVNARLEGETESIKPGQVLAGQFKGDKKIKNSWWR